MFASFQTDQAMGWTIEKSWFDSRLGQETSLLCETPEMAAKAVGSFHGAEGSEDGGKGVNLTTVLYLGWGRIK
jgi:hypothetical protein